MSDGNGATPPEVLATLTVTLMKDGKMSVSYPKDEVIGRYMLSKGSEIIAGEYRRLAATVEPNRILPATHLPRLG